MNALEAVHKIEELKKELKAIENAIRYFEGPAGRGKRLMHILNEEESDLKHQINRLTIKLKQTEL